MKTVHSSVMAFSLLVALTMGGSCNTPRAAVKPDDLSARQHGVEARKEEGAAADHRQSYRPAAAAIRGGPASEGNAEVNPTQHHLVSAAEHDRHAAQHRAAAVALKKYEDAMCAGAPAGTRDSCPFLPGSVASVEKIPNGVRLVLLEGANGNELLAMLQCHAAFSRAQHQVLVEDCAPYVPQVEVRLSADGRAVELTTAVAANVPELQQRAARQMPPPAR